MTEQVGIIGVGHLASYLVEGLKKAAPDQEIFLSEYLGDQTARLASDFGATPVHDNQAVADNAELVLVTTRPGDVLEACREVSFRPDQVVITTAVGVGIDALREAVAPAEGVLATPLTCSAINCSPTLLHPDHSRARILFELLGTVHVLDREDEYLAASAIGAYYGWVYALLDEGIGWATRAGVPHRVARDLVLETTRGAAEMCLAHPELEISNLLDSLATPGGITRQGLEILRGRGSLEAWSEALDAVFRRLDGERRER